MQNNVSEQLHTIPETGTNEISVSENSITVLEMEYEYYFENEKLYLDSNLGGLIDAPIIELADSLNKLGNKKGMLQPVAPPS